MGLVPRQECSRLGSIFQSVEGSLSILHNFGTIVGANKVDLKNHKPLQPTRIPLAHNYCYHDGFRSEEWRSDESLTNAIVYVPGKSHEIMSKEFGADWSIPIVKGSMDPFRKTLGCSRYLPVLGLELWIQRNFPAVDSYVAPAVLLACLGGFLYLVVLEMIMSTNIGQAAVET